MSPLTEIDVAVIVQPGAADDGPLEAALEALAVAGAPEPAVFRAEPVGGGLAAARNAALGACTAPVLALIEDDVAVSPGWWTALQAAWSAADADGLGVVGGPITPRIVGPRPPWLTDDLLAGYALWTLERPPDGLANEADPSGARRTPGDVDEPRTFHAGNLSVRADALRGVGGFWPVHGGPGARDWFSEEHRAQEALREAGWVARLAPEAVAERLIDPRHASRRALLARRARYGAREQLLSGRPRTAGDLAAGVARSGAGAVVASAQRQPGTAVERAARAAQGAGALLGDLLVHGERQPAASRTAFLASVPPAQPGPIRARAQALAARASRRATGAGGEPGPVLLYHRVVAQDADPLGLAVHPERFAEQLAVLAARGAVVPLAEHAAAGPGAAAITFDDGYADNLVNALPVLAAHRLPATLFASTGHIASGAGFWWDEVVRLVHHAPPDAGPLRLTVGGDARAWAMSSDAARAAAGLLLRTWLQTMAPETIEAVVAELRDWAGASRAPTPPPAVDRPMTIEELTAFHAVDGIEVGAHTRTHPSLAFVSPARQDAEIAGSRDDLAAWLGAAPAWFSYPFGVPGVDVDRGVHARVRAAGFTGAVVNRPGRPAPGTERFAVARCAVPDVGGEAFARWLDERSPAAR